MIPAGGPKGDVRNGLSLAVLAVSFCVALLVGWAAIRQGMAAWALRKDDLSAAVRWSPGSSTVLAKTAAADLKAGRDTEALAAARAALARAPYDGAALWVIGRVEGRDDRARRREIVHQASRLSRRDSAVSSWLIRDALASGDVRTVALQADMVLRRRVEVGDSVFRVLYGVIQTPAGRAAVAERLALKPPWRQPFLTSAGLAADPTAVVDLLIEMRGTGASPTDDEAHNLFRRLAVQQRYDELRRARSRIFGGPAGEGLVYDPDLNGLPGPPPLNWEPLSASGERYDWKPLAAQSGRIRVDRAGSTSTPLLRQMVFLGPGRYSVSVVAENAETEGDRAFTLEVQCHSRVVIGRAPIQTSSGGPTTTDQSFVVPPDGCAAQWIQVIAGADSVTATSILLDRIDVRPASANGATR
ncbi:hypothetical protein [Caulobacter sp. NIBR1757]|uniref:hypothetical protein n=1 Tax=Caulobacter sp. NIBR1757 TaxID=3016000 RepID=UPI0022F0F6B9|nr:hypothetical protein [Caulobacter sp. NIBR1757]WGM40028.1 hypothetical protein AMEJIAPC_02969 [Caulobacter sp. NIBR1757]